VPRETSVPQVTRVIAERRVKLAPTAPLARCVVLLVCRDPREIQVFVGMLVAQASQARLVLSGLTERMATLASKASKVLRVTKAHKVVLVLMATTVLLARRALSVTPAQRARTERQATMVLRETRVTKDLSVTKEPSVLLASKETQVPWVQRADSVCKGQRV